MNRFVYSMISLLFLLVTAKSYSQKIVFAQDCPYKNNMFSQKKMGAYIVEDTILNEKLIIFSGAKTVNFYHTDGKWKVIKMIEVPFHKKSAFSEDEFKVVSFSHKKDVWNLIVKNRNDSYTAERVDMAAGTYSVAGNVFEDKKPNWYSQAYTDGNSSYNLYVNRSGGLTLSTIDANLAIRSFPVNFQTQLPVNRTTKLDPVKEVYAALEEINEISCHTVFFTRRKNQFYIQPKTFSLVISGEEPYTELIVFDKYTGKRIKTELFSTGSLLPADSKNEKVNTNALLYDNKLWMITAYRNGGVLAVFDIETKQLLRSITYDETNPPANAAYGPVLYKMRPDAKHLAEEKLSTIHMSQFCKELFKERPCIYVIPFNDQEYAVSIASYAIDTYLAPTSATGDRIRGGSTYYSNPAIYNSATIGFIFNQSTGEIQNRKSSFNELNQKETGTTYGRIEEEYPVTGAVRESSDRRAYLIREQAARYKMYTIYYYEKQLKISVINTSMDLSKFDLLN